MKELNERTRPSHKLRETAATMARSKGAQKLLVAVPPQQRHTSGLPLI